MMAAMEWKRLWRRTVQDYFAPLAGTYKGIRAEWRRIDRQARRSRTTAPAPADTDQPRRA